MFRRKPINAKYVTVQRLPSFRGAHRFPVTHRRAIRTTNLLERLFVEERRRLRIISNPFGERAILQSAHPSGRGRVFLAG